MTDEAPSARAREHPFLKGLDASLLDMIEDGAARRTFATEDILAREGTPATEFYLVESGKVALELDAPGRPHLTLQTVGPGEMLGWSWVIPGERWRFHARALKPTVAWEVDAARVRDALADLPAAGFEFLLRMIPVVSSRLEHTRLQLLDLYAP